MWLGRTPLSWQRLAALQGDPRAAPCHDLKEDIFETTLRCCTIVALDSSPPPRLFDFVHHLWLPRTGVGAWEQCPSPVSPRAPSAAGERGRQRVTIAKTKWLGKKECICRANRATCRARAPSQCCCPALLRAGCWAEPHSRRLPGLAAWAASLSLGDLGGVDLYWGKLGPYSGICGCCLAGGQSKVAEGLWRSSTICYSEDRKSVV